MSAKLGDSLFLDFIISNPFTGEAVDADATPTAECFEDNVDSSFYTPSITKRTNKTGDYRAYIQTTDGNGFELNKSYNVIVTATVQGVVNKAVIATFVIDAFKKPNGSIVADGSNTNATFKTDLSNTTDDFCKDCLCLFYTGNLLNEVKKITGYNGTTKFITISGNYSSIPSNGDKVLIINI